MTRQAITRLCVRFALLFSAGLVVFVGSRPCVAFSTYRMLGGQVHRAIIQTALTPCGFTRKSLSRIIAGCEAQDDPTGPNFAKSECHATDNKVTPTFGYVRATLARAATLADGCEKSDISRQKTLYALGQAFHALQDFYSHSNYLEYLLSQNKALEPVDWNGPPEQVRTCHYFYEGFFRQEAFGSRAEAVAALTLSYPDLTFHSESKYGTRTLLNCPESTVLEYALAPVSFTHTELNKDNDRTLEGCVVSSRYQKTYHQLARELAEKDTARAWRMFENAVRYKYNHRAEAMLLALKLSENDSRTPKASKEAK